MGSEVEEEGGGLVTIFGQESVNNRLVDWSL